MIGRDDVIYIKWIAIQDIRVWEHQVRFPDRLLHYLRLLVDNPDRHTGPVTVSPDPQHDGLYCLLDGHHRYCAAILAGRKELCAVVIKDASWKV